MTKSTQDKTRVQLDLAPALVERIDQLVNETGSSTRAEVFRRALSIFALLVDEAKRGSKTEIITASGEHKTIVVF
jgi:metal-responsive CopG/Arc/MetJ family transcriptional regulator